MKKKNLIILLLIPFIISILGIVTINVSFSTFYGDITSIDWNYSDVEAFSIHVSKYQLLATPKNSSDAPLDTGNQLVWKVENKNPEILEPIAEILIENGRSYLIPKAEGEVIITCSNLKGNVFRKMDAILYGDGVITLQPTISSSQSNIDSKIYYGQYDLDNGSKVSAEFELEYKCIPEDLNDNLTIETSSNISATKSDGKINVRMMSMTNDSEAYVKLISGGISSHFEFNVVKDGVNVYTYDDLMYCTNKSKNGEIVVLRKNFESLKTYQANNQNNVELFGRYNLANKSFSFDKEIYKFETTFNSEYIKQWNNFVKTNSNYKAIDNKILAGLRVQKDFYGNGYTINMHNLTYPTQITEVEQDGQVYQIPTLASTDLFRGPLPFYTLGDPNSMPLITSYGQDNVGMYIDGDNITVNDVNIRNCDMGASLQFLETVGTVLEVNGSNNIIKNSRLSNGKNIVRSFSSMNLKIDNSLLSTSMNFLITTGSNEYLSYDEASSLDFTRDNGTQSKSTLLEYLSKNAAGDTSLNNFLLGGYSDKDLMKKSLDSIQNALNPVDKIEGLYKGTMMVNDTYFYQSGLAAVCCETLFNGPFLYSGSPSIIGDVFSMLNLESRPIAPYIATKVSGLSYPVKVELTGNTRFYDYKTANDIDLSGLIEENISSIASEITGTDRVVTIDEIFPLKTLLVADAAKKNCINNSKINVPVAYYGGAANLSTVSFEGLEYSVQTESISVDFAANYLDMPPASTSNLMAMVKDMMVKCVTVVTGFEPFEFVCVKGNGYLVNETPNISDLITNAKGV